MRIVNRTVFLKILTYCIRNSNENVLSRSTLNNEVNKYYGVLYKWLELTVYIFVTKNVDIFIFLNRLRSQNYNPPTMQFVLTQTC